MAHHVIELEDGVWLADGDGDPPRTLVKDHAKKIACMGRANLIMKQITALHPRKHGWPNARAYLVCPNSKQRN